MDSLGTLLQSCRLEAEFTLKDISTVTRIPQRILIKLEADDFTDLPAEIYIKGFIKAYCHQLKLDASQALDLYSKQVHSVGVATDSNPELNPVFFDDVAGHGSSFRWSHLIIIIIALATFLITFLVVRTDQVAGDLATKDNRPTLPQTIDSMSSAAHQ